MTTEQNKLADELAAISGRCSVENDRATIIMAVAALRAAGEPVAYKCQRCGYNRDQHAGVDVAHCGEFVDAAQPAPSASVREALERCIRICMEEASEWDSDRLQNYKNYAGHCANRISTEVLATPSPLMAAGEAAETDIMETLDRKIEHAKCMQKRAFDHGLDVQGERMHARQEAFLEVKAILMKGSVATSPAKRDYAARVMGVSVDPVESESDQVRCGPIGEDDWKDQRIASLEAYIAQLKDQQAMAEPMREEIAKQLSALVDAIDIYQFSPEGSIEARHASQDLADAVDEAKRILALKPRGGQTREETIEECAKVCERFAGANAASEPYISYAQGRTEGGQALAAHIRALSKPRGEPAREGGE